MREKLRKKKEIKGLFALAKNKDPESDALAQAAKSVSPRVAALEKASWPNRLRPPAGVLSFFLGLTIVCRAQASQPVLKELVPPGAQRGHAFTLTLKGEELPSGAEVITTLPATLSRLAPSKDVENPDTQLEFLVQVPEDTPVGLYPVRVRTDDGLSNLLIFSVGDLPEISEKEPNDSLAEAQPVTAPAIVNGHLNAADQDFYRLTAKARERLVIEVEARRMGSAIDPVVEVLDSSGHRIAFNDDAPGLGFDARVDVTFPKAGTYYVVVHDAKYSEHEENFYRLKLGNFAYADGIFPLGWQRGKPVEVTFIGGNLPKPVKVRLSVDVPADRESVAVNLPGTRPVGSLPFQFRVSDLPELITPKDGSITQLEPSTVVNGLISRPGQIDRYKFRVSAGQKWLFDLESASLGTSQLYGSLTVYDAQGKKVPVKDAGEGPDPKIALTVPDKTEEVTLAVQDVRGQGGPAYGYRLVATAVSEDFRLKILTPYVNVPEHGSAAIEVVAERNGYEGPIQLSIPDLPSDLLAQGGIIPGQLLDYSGVRRRSNFGYITLMAKPGAKHGILAMSIWGQGGPSDNPIRRRAENSNLVVYVKGEYPEEDPQGDPLPPKPVTFSWLGLDLPVAISRGLPVSLEIVSPSVRLVQGMEAPIEWKLIKQDPGIVPLEVAGLPLPFNKDLNFRREGKAGDAGSILIRSTPDAPLVKIDAVLRATVQVNGKQERVTSRAVTVELVRGYSIALASEHVALRKGEKVELAGTIHREPNFPGTVKVALGDPPEKVSCPAVEVPAGKSEFRLVCDASPEALTGDFEVHLVSSATVPERKDKREFTIPPIPAHMVVMGKAPPASAVRNTGP